MKLKEIPKSIYIAVKLRLNASSQKPQKPIKGCIVSLTSIPERLSTLHLTIMSLLQQSVQPDKIILWLNDSLAGNIPKTLKNLESDLFQIEYRQGTTSHRKLIFSLDEFSEHVVVTCDDDVMYPKNWLGSLFENHLQYPDCVVANECREISYDSSGEPLSYKEWPTIAEVGYTSENLLPIGYGGVLYPPGVLHKDVTKEALYMELAPRADDLWFKAMSLLNSIKVYRSSSPTQKPIPIVGAKGNSLAKTNINQDGNRTQWKAICDHYGIH